MKRWKAGMTFAMEVSELITRFGNLNIAIGDIATDSSTVAHNDSRVSYPPPTSIKKGGEVSQERTYVNYSQSHPKFSNSKVDFQTPPRAAIRRLPTTSLKEKRGSKADQTPQNLFNKGERGLQKRGRV